MYYHNFLGHLWDIFMSHRLRDIFGTLLGLIRHISKATMIQEFNKIIHRKGRKEHKAMKQESLRLLRSLRLNASSVPAHERAPPAVHSRSSRAGR